MPRTPATPDPARQLMIKTKTCQRLLKEVDYYKKEVKENETKLASLKEEKRDPYDIKKFEEVLGESYMMVPDSEGRLKKSLEDLAQFLHSDDFRASSRDGGDDVKERQPDQWETTAQEMLAEHLPQHATQIIDETQTATIACEVKETDVTDLEDDEAF